MKKIIISGVILLFGVVQYAQAQWTSEVSNNTKVSTASLSTADQPEITTNKFGTTFITWVQTDPLGRYGFALYAQAMDKNGNRLWGNNGVRVDTLSGTVRFVYNIAADSTGNLVIGSQNNRVNRDYQFPVIYKLDKDLGTILWKKELQATGDLYELAPFFAITPSNNILVSTVGVKLTAIGSGELSVSYVDKLDGTTGNSLWPQRLVITDAADATSNGVPQVTMADGENFFVTWQQKDNTVGNGQTLNRIMVRKYKADQSPVWAAPVVSSPSHRLALGYFAKPFSDGAGGIVVTYMSTGAVGSEFYGQYIDANGAVKWGTDGLLLAQNSKGSGIESGLSFDPATKKLWFTIRQDLPTNTTRAYRLYLQGVDINKNFAFDGTAFDGAEIIPAGNGGAAESINGIGMRDTKDGFIVVYQQGDAPFPGTIKATKVDYLGKKPWPDGDSVIIVSTAPGLQAAKLGSYVVADSQLVVVALLSKSSQFLELAQNIKYGGTIGTGTVKQAVSFNTDTITVIYGDQRLDLGATSSIGQTPQYFIDDLTLAEVDGNNKIHLLGVGTFHVYAHFNGDAVYMPKTTGTKVIIVKKRALKVVADEKIKEYGRGLPTLTMHFESFVNGDDVLSFKKLPTITTTATTNSPLGVYPIRLQGGESSKYELQLVPAKLIIYPTTGVGRDNLQAYCSSPETLQVAIYSMTDQTGYLQLMDLSGKMLWNKQVTAGAGISNFQLPAANMAAGVYVVRFIGNNSTMDQKVKIK